MACQKSATKAYSGAGEKQTNKQKTDGEVLQTHRRVPIKLLLTYVNRAM